ncbi:MAG: aminotransferase class IV [Saprospiraceae bacterium]
MKTCLETIKVQNGKLYNVSYHNARLNRTRRMLFNSQYDIDLHNIIAIPDNLSENIYKCRVIYDIDIINIEFTPYQIKPIHSLQLIEANELDYSYKYLDRNVFTELLQHTTADDILIVKNGFLTDTSYANVVFWDGNQWLTPATPLLPGTKRQYLLDIELIKSSPLRPADLHRFSQARLINALLDLDNGPIIPIQNIF